MGIIQDGPFHGETFVLWATALLLIQASAYSAPVHSRRDVDQRKKLLLQHVLQTGLVLWLIANATGRNPSYRASIWAFWALNELKTAAIWAFWALNMLKTAAKIVEMIQSSRSDMFVKVVAEYMAPRRTSSPATSRRTPSRCRGTGTSSTPRRPCCR